jgi:hypothetical protein
MISWVRHFLEYLGGAADSPPDRLTINLASPWWGLWWGILLIAIIFFCGQSSKFIYIDF